MIKLLQIAGLFAGVLATYICVYAACSYDVSHIVHSGKFKGSPFWKGRANLVDCAIACVRRRICMGFNLESMEHCELFVGVTNRVGHGIKRDDYTVYSYIANWTYQIDPNCFSRPCGDDAVCMPGKFGSNEPQCSHTCINSTLLCPLPSANFSGPRTVGSTYECDGTTITCTDKRTWSDTCWS